MIVRRVHIKDGIVVNISVGDTKAEWQPPKGETILEFDPNRMPEDAAIGATFDGTKFSRPQEVVVPETKTIDQRLAELEARLAKLETKK